MQVYADINDWAESCINSLLNQCLQPHYSSCRNNLRSNDIDLLLSNGTNNLKVDVQYSFNYLKYGDVRIDLVSAGIRHAKWQQHSIRELNAILRSSKQPFTTLKSILDIKKRGKYFNDKDILGVVYLIYNHARPANLTLEQLKKLLLTV